MAEKRLLYHGIAAFACAAPGSMVQFWSVFFKNFSPELTLVLQTMIPYLNDLRSERREPSFRKNRSFSSPHAHLPHHLLGVSA